MLLKLNWERRESEVKMVFSSCSRHARDSGYGITTVNGSASIMKMIPNIPPLLSLLESSLSHEALLCEVSTGADQFEHS